MGEVERYPNGTFCWVDLGTTDAPGAKAFYGGLLEWELDDLPTGDKGPYSICRRDGKAVAGLYDPAETPTWGSYLSVDDADRAAATASELGGTVLLPPMDIPVGRFTILADPQGAAFTASAVPGGSVRGVDGSEAQRRAPAPAGWRISSVGVRAAPRGRRRSASPSSSMWATNSTEDPIRNRTLGRLGLPGSR